MDLLEYEMYLREFFDEFRQKGVPYQDLFWRNLRMNAYTNRQKSESKFMKEFKDKFGGPDEATVFLGDWSARHTLRGQVCK